MKNDNVNVVKKGNMKEVEKQQREKDLLNIEELSTISPEYAFEVKKDSFDVFDSIQEEMNLLHYTEDQDLLKDTFFKRGNEPYEFIDTFTVIVNNKEQFNREFFNNSLDETGELKLFPRMLTVKQKNEFDLFKDVQKDLFELDDSLLDDLFLKVKI